MRTSTTRPPSTTFLLVTKDKDLQKKIIIKRYYIHGGIFVLFLISFEFNFFFHSHTQIHTHAHILCDSYVQNEISTYKKNTIEGETSY